MFQFKMSFTKENEKKYYWFVLTDPANTKKIET